MRKVQNFYVKLFTLFMIIIYIYPLYTTAQERRTFLHVEEKDYGPESPPVIQDLKKYDDGTVVLRIVRKNMTSTPDEPCYNEMFHLRIIHPNGQVEEKDIDLDIQQFNYCLAAGTLYIRHELIRKDQILVTYYNETDHNEYEECGMIIDFNGKVLDRISFGPVIAINNSTKKPDTQSDINLSINSEKGFIRITYHPYEINLINIGWKQYRIGPDGKITSLTSGELITGIISIAYLSAVSTVDGGYVIIYTNMTNNPIEILPQSQIFATFIGYNQNQIDTVTFSLYQTQLVNIKPSFCDFEYVGVGQSCLFTSAPSSINGTNVYLKINFLSFGSVVSFKIMSFNSYTLNGSLHLSDEIKFLPFGGNLLTTLETTDLDPLYHANYILISENGTVGSSYQLALEQIESAHISLILPNNTLLVYQDKNNSNSWGFYVIDLFKFNDINNQYFNTHIESTFPNSSIDSDITNISIDFYHPIELSIGNLSIYQTDQKISLRQLTSGNQCTLDNNNKRVNVKILDSTFSKSGGNFSIKIDNNFVKHRLYKEPLLGVAENIWNFTIDNKKSFYNITSTTSGLLQLTVEGTKEFENLLNDNKFFNPLLNELADTVQISRERLSKNKHQIINSNSNEKRLLISIKIQETKDHYEKDVNTIISDFNTSIVFKDQTPIGQGQFTRNLDSNFGFKPSPNYWDEYKYKLLGLLIAVISLVILFILAYRREKKGHNIVIFQFTLIILDFILDILFVKNNANDIPVLYIPSLVFFTIPIGFNTISAFLIMSKENKNQKFFQWFTNNFKFASIFTILAGADVEILNILQSNLAGFKTFQAPFSDSSKFEIFWVAFVNIFLEDIPQLIIQIIYRHYSVSYDIIPILTLISSMINLTINIVGRLYQAINHIRNRKKASNNNLEGTN